MLLPASGSSTGRTEPFPGILAGLLGHGFWLTRLVGRAVPSAWREYSQAWVLEEGQMRWMFDFKRREG